MTAVWNNEYKGCGRHQTAIRLMYRYTTMISSLWYQPVGMKATMRLKGKFPAYVSQRFTGENVACCTPKSE